MLLYLIILSMSNYFCPYCSKSYQFHKRKSDGVMICGLCGEPLFRRGLVRWNQIFALIAAFAFLSPLVMSIFALLRDNDSSTSIYNVKVSETFVVQK